MDYERSSLFIVLSRLATLIMLVNINKLTAIRDYFLSLIVHNHIA